MVDSDTALHVIEAAHVPVDTPPIPPVGGRPNVNEVIVGQSLLTSAGARARQESYSARSETGGAHNGDVAVAETGGIMRHGGYGGVGDEYAVGRLRWILRVDPWWLINKKKAGVVKFNAVGLLFNSTPA